VTKFHKQLLEKLKHGTMTIALVDKHAMTAVLTDSMKYY